jgi:hypothetical protein
MSARGRKRKDAPPTEVAAFEFYPTPPSAILSLVESHLVTLPGGRWIDPCAGTGRIPSTVNGIRSDVRWILAEIDARHADALSAVERVEAIEPFRDFVTAPWSHPFADVLIMNPPFSHALDFVRVGMERAATVVMLQRLNWLAPARASWLRSYMPDTYVLPRRPSFTGDGSTDAAEYAWFVWPTGERRSTATVAMLSDPRQAEMFPEVAA